VKEYIFSKLPQVTESADYLRTSYINALYFFVIKCLHTYYTESCNHFLKYA